MQYNKEMQTVVDQINQLEEIIPVLDELENQLFTSNPTNLDYQTTVAFIADKSVDVLQLVEKRLNKLKSKVAEQFAQVCLAARQKNYSNEHCTMTPNPDVYMKYPDSPDKEGFEDFVKQLPLKVLRPHYPSMLEHLAECMQDGQQAPYGLTSESIHPIHKVRIRSKKEL